MNKINKFIDSTAGAVLFSLAFTAAVLLTAKDAATERKKERANPEIVLIDSCEYIVVPGGMFSETKYTHKANCKNHSIKQ